MSNFITKLFRKIFPKKEVVYKGLIKSDSGSEHPLYEEYKASKLVSVFTIFESKSGHKCKTHFNKDSYLKDKKYISENTYRIA